MNGCAFCEEIIDPYVKGPLKDQSRILWEDEDFWLVPTVGCTVPFYVLLMPKDHYYNFGEFLNDTPELQARFDYVVEKVSQWVTGHVEEREKHRTSRCFVFEHGAVNACVKGAQCCDHAHLHFVPLPTFGKLGLVLNKYFDVSRDAEFIPNLTTLVNYRNCAYLMCTKPGGGYYVWKDPKGFQTQFGRKATAEVLGKPDQWNWKIHPNLENLRFTVDKMRGTNPMIKR